MKSRTPSRRAVAVCIDTRDGAGRNRLHGVAQFVRRLGWRMMLVRQGGRAAAQDVARLTPDGIIAYIADPWLIDVAKRMNVPLVDTAMGDLAVSYYVSVDNEIIGRLAADHLTRAGLRHFGYCGVRGRMASEERRACLAAALPEHSIQAFSDSLSEGESRLGPLMRWLKRLPKPIGLLTFDDKLGERVLTACRWANLTVPHEVAVLGIGDDQLMCEVSWPTLSSISLSTSRLGYEAAKLLAEVMSGRKIRQPHVKVQPTTVVGRGSTDMVAVEDVLVKDTIQVVRARAGEMIGVEQIAQALHVSRRTLDRRFHAALGRTVGDEVARTRMQTARAMLADDAHAIGAVARLCGYGNSASFSRAFHRHSGHWPSDYRREMRMT